MSAILDAQLFAEQALVRSLPLSQVVKSFLIDFNVILTLSVIHIYFVWVIFLIIFVLYDN